MVVDGEINVGELEQLLLFPGVEILSKSRLPWMLLEADVASISDEEIGDVDCGANDNDAEDAAVDVGIRLFKLK